MLGLKVTFEADFIFLKRRPSETRGVFPIVEPVTAPKTEHEPDVDHMKRSRNGLRPELGCHWLSLEHLKSNCRQQREGRQQEHSSLKISLNCLADLLLLSLLGLGQTGRLANAFHIKVGQIH